MKQIQNKPLGKNMVRRRIQLRTALFLSLGAFTLLLLVSLLRTALNPAGLASVAYGALSTLLCFLLPALLGLFVLDGDQRQMLPLRALSAPHTLFLALTGVLFVCPASLLSDMPMALMQRMGFPAPQSAAVDSRLLLPMLLSSGLLAPVAEELFFRGYLLGVMERRGARGAVWGTALLFAAVHGFGAAFPAHLLLGALLGLMTLRTGSLLSAVLVHASYNITLLLLSSSALSTLFSGMTLISCTVRLLGSAACLWAFTRAYRARALRTPAQLHVDRLSLREGLLLCAAALVFLLSLIISGGNAA